ncbi:uncharacterized protein DUF3618 [Hoeflea halophila]|uniref:Uncharacterized protein DUF3618 n=1 Tax=Hoeflea halophila TaxID=714899 RepID=A0A286HL89_9HYPH|nr:DUF3618 domain-containing protein [Hoeflea halophila]SOE08531.1 uncharacterized protein DUF3618 [Hoeflea halophila]
MTNNSRNVQEIERDIERERAQLSRSLDALQSQFSLEGIFRQASDQVSRHGGEFGSSISRSVKSNPIALALTGIGLAWMIYGENRRHDEASLSSRTTSRPLDTSPFGEDRTAAYGRHSTVGDYGSAGGASNSASSRLSDAADTVSGAASDAKRAASDRWDRAQSTASNYADSASAYARRTRASAEDLRRRLYEGTENLSESARQKVVAARERAQQAQERVEDAARRGKSEAVDFFNSQPLVAGALALAVGAAIGALAPRTRTEDDAAGAHSDRLFAEAERVFREEAEKAEKVVKKAATEAKTVAREEKAKADSKAPGDKTAAEAAVSKAKSSGKRVASAAKEEASKQKLGQPKSGSN